MKDNSEVITVKKPSECSETELQDFANLVREGGEVTEAGLDERIKKAEALVFLSQGGCLKGIVAVKNPDQNYKQGVFRRAQATVRASEFPFEIGWMFVVPSSRGAGFSYKLMEAALAATNGCPIFAASRSDNAPIHKMLQAYGFSYHGKAYVSSSGNHDLVLFISRGAQQCTPGDAPKVERS